MRLLFAALLMLTMSCAGAQDIYMIRSTQSFPEAMTALQEAIKGYGYTVSRVQRVDIGLTAAGYKTDKYRIVFFAKLDELNYISSRHIGLVPYLPLKIAIYAEGEDTILLAASLGHLKRYYAEADLSKYLDRWEKDIASILEKVRVSE